jgi:adenine-specific DNA methylase
MGNFGGRTIVEQAETGKWEEMNPNFVRDMLVRGVANHPRTVAETLRKQVNRGVFSNGEKNEVHRLDVFEFLGKVDGSVLYADPPYAATSSYESSLKPLDSILERRIVKSTPSAFSKKDGVRALERLLEESQRFPVLVLSYGNVTMNLEALVKLVERFRPVVVAKEFRFTHVTGLCSEARRERNRELLVVARR